MGRDNIRIIIHHEDMLFMSTPVFVAITIYCNARLIIPAISKNGSNFSNSYTIRPLTGRTFALLHGSHV